MLTKVCGLTKTEDLKTLSKSSVDMLGFIFAESSPRFLKYQAEFMKELALLQKKKVGVFVNAPEYFIRAKAELFQLDTIQLHGDEDNKLIQSLAADYSVIKAISISDDTDFTQLHYPDAHFLLFDTKGKHRGGNGIKFNWDMLQKYHGEVPFLLSGGIGPDDVKSIYKIQHPKFAGVDVNSKFEVAPGIKNTQLIQEFLMQVK